MFGLVLVDPPAVGIKAQYTLPPLALSIDVSTVLPTAISADLPTVLISPLLYLIGTHNLDIIISCFDAEGAKNASLSHDFVLETWEQHTNGRP